MSMHMYCVKSESDIITSVLLLVVWGVDWSYLYLVYLQ